MLKVKDQRRKLVTRKLNEERQTRKGILKRHGKQTKGLESQIRNLEMNNQRLLESADQTRDETKQVSHTHIYIQTLLHKQHIHASHGIR